jgi:hypothetical protein
MEENIKAPEIVISKDSEGKTVVKMTNTSPDELSGLICDAVESVVELQQCPPDMITRAVTNSLINASDMVKLGHEKENRASDGLLESPSHVWLPLPYTAF